MTSPDTAAFSNALEWLSPWTGVGADGPRLEQALQRELGPGHVLQGRRAHAVGRRADRDDVLFAVEGPLQFVVVHLTYSKHKSADWPQIIVFDSLEEFVVGCMQPDHAEHVESDEDD